MHEKTYTGQIQTADGEFTATYSNAGLCGLKFPPFNGTSRSVKSGSPDLANPLIFNAPAASPPNVQRWHALAIEALANALDGREPGRLPPLDLSHGTEFQRAVWTILCRIPCGRTLSYGEVAKALSRPGAARAVGGACGANPVPVLIPCHRVLAAGQKLGGFSADPNWKRLLLTREGSL